MLVLCLYVTLIVSSGVGMKMCGIVNGVLCEMLCVLMVVVVLGSIDVCGGVMYSVLCIVGCCVYVVVGVVLCVVVVLAWW